MNNFTLENLELRHDVITTLIEHPGIYTNRMAADTLGVCIRTIQRLKKIFDGSLESLYHGNYGLRRQLKITTEMKSTCNK